MKFKEGVSLVGVKDVIIQIWPKIDKVYKEITNKEATVTSVTDGKHMEGSLHYQGLAADIRFWDILEEVRRRLREELGSDFDIVLEKDHFHIELSPSGLKKYK